MSSTICTTVGMFIMDTFDVKQASFDTSLVPEQTIGGGGVYVTLGGRIWLEENEVGMIIDRGSDWPQWVQDQLDTFGPIFIFRDDSSRLTTKAINTYTGEKRDFAYLTPKKRLDPIDLSTTRLHGSKYLHCVCLPQRLEAIIADLEQYHWKPKIAYEPIPDGCLPENLDHLQKILGSVQVFSPNHEEAASFFGERAEGKEAIEAIESLCKRFVDMGANQVVIRSGSLGACGLVKGGECIWVSAYHTELQAGFDPTGAGNAFIGGLIAGLHLRDDDLTEGMLYGSVSASFVLEQYGICSFDTKTNRWNGSSKQPHERLDELRKRVSDI